MSVELRTLQALRLWHDVHLDLVRDDEPDLSSRQIAIRTRSGSASVERRKDIGA